MWCVYNYPVNCIICITFFAASLINLIFLILFWEVELNRVLKLLCWFSSEVIITDCWLLYVRVVCVVKVADNRCAVHEMCSAGGRAGARFTSDLRTVAALLHGWETTDWILTCVTEWWSKNCSHSTIRTRETYFLHFCERLLLLPSCSVLVLHGHDPLLLLPVTHKIALLF